MMGTKGRFRALAGKFRDLMPGAPVARPAVTSPEDEAFVSFVSAHFEPRWYLETYPDVAAAGADPLLHWLLFGLEEGRSAAPNMMTRRGPDASRIAGGGWKNFTWRQEPVALRVAQVPETIVAQIRAQGRHDPAVLAAGALAIPKLPHIEAVDLISRDGIDVHGIFTAIPERPDVILLIPRLVVGGAEKYAADIVDALVSKGRKRVLVIVTEQAGELAAADCRNHAIFAPFRAARIVFWPDICGPSHKSPTVMARLLNALRPGATIVVNSRLGLETVSRFGRGLSQFSRLYCAYFSLGVDGLGAPYGTRFPRRTLPFSTTLTDNEPMAAILRDRYGDLQGPGIAVLPPRLRPASGRSFAERLEKRTNRPVPASRRWAWVSRIEWLKGTDILRALARLRPGDVFELFGPLQGALGELGLIEPNIIYRGVLDDVADADFSSHDGFIFTSLFEGMPNVVLEMSQHAIPMVLANIGGLRDTFDDNAAFFIDTAITEDATAASFSTALDRVGSLMPAELALMVTAARDQAVARHSPEAHTRGVANLPGLA